MRSHKRFSGSLWWGMAGVVLGATLMWFYLAHIGPLPLSSKADCIKKYPLTSHLLDCDTYDDSSTRLHTLEQDLNDLSNAYITEGKATDISVWVRDLTTLQWASVNDTERYAPASLLKLPLLIAYYKIAQIEPSILDAPITFEPSSVLSSSSQDFLPDNPLVAGKTYKVSELIEHMIVESDNDAAAMLLSHIDQSVFENTLIDLGIKIPSSTQNYDFVTVKSYGAIFRTLYNASYLDRAYSQQALSLLSKSTFKGLNDPLPPSVIVAQKFGERVFTDSGANGAETHELHDCGIVYKTDRPYMLCVMTEGKNFDDLLSIIKSVSRLTYNSL